MTMAAHAQTRDDLNTADKIVRAVWDNFIATEPTYVLRDLIVIELQKARDAEREACAHEAEKILQGWRAHSNVTSAEQTLASAIAAAIRARGQTTPD